MKSNFRNHARILRYMEITIIGVSEAHFRAFLGSFHEDYKILLLFIEKGGVAYGGDRDNPRRQDTVREKYELGSSKALKTNARKR
uniref:Putative ovule protein n=1 Tax=Solanum chacoense TaxID=4108 RepID=A0A0V0HES1_SOLCH